MRKIIHFIAAFCFLTVSAVAQVTFVVDSLPAYTPAGDILYIAGDFQGWNPGDPNFALEKNLSDKWSITLDSAANGTTLQFKFTRGDWGKVEKGILGEEIPNREFTFGNGDTVSVIIYNWADAGGSGNSTAAENVHILDEEFYMPQLDRSRRIWIYLPPDYQDSEDRYPVLYMHDGQNLFDTYTSFAGEWEVDETLNELANEGYFVPIVVGIDNGGNERINEYTPWVHTQYGGGQGALYIDFIVETLKPYIDEHYRTRPEREFTGIWGSSLGGLISHYGILKYQEVFSKAGIYSPSYWWSDTVWTFTEEAGIQEDLKLYQMTGELEGQGMVANTWLMDDLFHELGLEGEELTTKIVEGGEHNEQLWRDDFEAGYLWLFHSFANTVAQSNYERIRLFPNPAAEVLRLPATIHTIDRLRLYSMTGVYVEAEVNQPLTELNVSNLPPGMYVLTIVQDQKVYQGTFLKN